MWGTALWLAVAVAVTAAPNRQKAGEHFERAVGLYDAKNYAAALTEFRAAYDAAPSFEVLFNIGLCQRRLFKYGDAVATLEAYLRQGGNRITKDRRAAVAQELAEVRNLTAPVTVHAAGPPASVSIDGEVVGFTPLEKLLVGVGPRVFRVAREGFEPVEEKRDIVSGQPLLLEYELEAKPPPPEPAPVAVPPPARAEPHVVKQPPPASKPVKPGLILGIGGLALGGALAATGFALSAEGRTVSNEITLLSQIGGTWNDSWAEREKWGKTARGLGPAAVVVGLALFAAGGVATAINSVVEPEKPSLTVAPLPEGGGIVAVGGRF